MNKEEILAKAQKENKNMDLVELEINKKAADSAATASAIVCFILYVAENIICNTRNYSLWSILAASLAVSFLYKGIKLKDKSKLAIGILWTIILLISITTAVITLLKTAEVI